MKQFLLVFLFAICAFAQLDAQICEPEQMYADSAFGVYPPPYDENTMTGGIDESACINSPYYYQLTFKVPDTIIITEPFPVAAAVEKIEVDGLSGAPVGLVMATNPADGVFTPDDVLGCAAIYGTATDANTPGEYDLVLEGTVYTDAIDISFEQLFALLGTGGYTLTLEEEGSTTCFVSTSVDEYLTDNVKVTTAPNPFADRTVITIQSDINETLQFNVVNILGEQVHAETIDVGVGENSIEFDGSHLANGVYQFTFSNGNAALTQKVVLQK